MTDRSAETDDPPPGSDELIRSARAEFTSAGRRTLSEEMAAEARAAAAGGMELEAAQRIADSQIAALMAEAAALEAEARSSIDIDLHDIVETREPRAPTEAPTRRPTPPVRHPETPARRSPPRPPTRRSGPPSRPPSRPRGPFDRGRTGSGPRTGLIGLVIAAAVILGILDDLDLGSLFDSDDGAGDTVTTTVATAQGPNQPTQGHLLVSALTRLEADHVGTVEFTRNGAVLNCNGHEIRGSGSGDGILLEGVRDGTVTGCVVRDFEVGIFLVEGGGNRLEGNRILGTTEAGIRVDNSHRNTVLENSSEASGGVGILLIRSTRNLLVSNQVSQSELECVKLETESNNNTLNENTCTGSTSAGGFVVLDSTGNTLSGNAASSNATDGFAIEDDSEGTLLIDNSATENGANGFAIGSDGNRLENNLANANTDAGIHVDASTDNELRNNRADSNGTFGIVEAEPAGRNTYAANTCEDNATDPSRPPGLCSG